MIYSTVFGPVRSGRLGISLGLDLLGAPICSMDCLYCEVGPTRTLTRQRRAYVPAARVLGELAAWKRDNPAPEVITLGGLGEPCLNSEMAEILAGARALFPNLPLAVLTNSTALADPEVRRELSGADIVLPSLDSLVESEFKAVNRPAAGITAAGVAESILALRAGFSGRICLEVLLCAGVNDSAENLALLTDYVARLRPERTDVVTLSRPGAHPGARAAGDATLARFREALGAGEPERVDRQAEAGRTPLTENEFREIVSNSLRRRPQTPGQISDAMGVPEERVRTLLQQMEQSGAVTCNNGFYALTGIFTA